MSKDPLGGLAQSLQDENAAVDERFERAGRVLGEQGSSPQKKSSVIRDTFSFPDFDYVLLSELQKRCLQGGHHSSKSELVRAGLKALIQMKPDELLRALKLSKNSSQGGSGAHIDDINNIYDYNNTYVQYHNNLRENTDDRGISAASSDQASRKRPASCYLR